MKSLELLVQKKKKKRRSLHANKSSSNLKVQLRNLASETAHPVSTEKGLPYDMISEVLVRSDVGVVLRCKSLCKYFYTSLGSFKFTKEHYEQRNNDQRLIVRLKNSLFLMYNEDLSQHKRLSDVNMPDYYEVMGNLDGVYCVMHPCFGFMALLNLSTKQLKKLARFEKNLFTFHRAVGLGLDPVSGVHKVVVMAYLADWVVEEQCRCAVYVCTSVDDSWRRLCLSDVDPVVLKCPVTPSITSTFLKGVYYWLLDDVASDFATVIGFDMGSEKFNARRVGDRLRAAQRVGTLALHGDALELLMLDRHIQLIEIWRMEKPESWTRSFTIGLHPFQDVDRVLFYWKRDEILLETNGYSSVLIVYDASSHKSKRIGTHQGSGSRNITSRYHNWVFTYKDSIVRINGDTEQWDSSNGFFFPY